MGVIRIGAVTIGQSPRDDVVPELSSRFGSGVEIVQRGALDDLSLDLVRAQKPVSAGTTLVSRMRDGTEIEIEKSFVLSRLQTAVQTLEAEVQLILLLCTAPFDSLESEKPLLRPAQILDHIIGGMRVGRLGVLTPSPKQIPAQRLRWLDCAREEVVVEAASPYLEKHRLENATMSLIDEKVDLVVMDCIGYTGAMRQRVRNMMRTPVLSALGVLGSVAAEMLDCETS